ncbi:DNA gyrase inhibitor YacG [Dongia sedimenti]|uniref:DNA gyrase inhibitor YacG n=1 Tax=Dongia sedimenti TaxID=3064282 RepID=A0ABU0YM94_9PROT|nr:DNA gyrase inhibitor YacG [Rhodospirillaceae bacterium R-7]
MAKCPNCGKPVVVEFRPFCSARCKQVDLNRWFSESYRVPVGNVDEDEDEAARPDRSEEP